MNHNKYLYSEIQQDIRFPTTGLWFSWGSGYHISLTHRRSPVRSRAKTMHFLSLSLVFLKTNHVKGFGFQIDKYHNQALWNFILHGMIQLQYKEQWRRYEKQALPWLCSKKLTLQFIIITLKVCNLLVLSKQSRR